MPLIPNRFRVEFGEVFPLGCFVLGVEPAMEFNEDRNAPKRQERDKETNQPLWTVRALDANEEVARFDAEFKVKIAAPHQPVPPAKPQGFPYAAVEFEGLTVAPYVGKGGRVAYSLRATSLRAPAPARASKPQNGSSAPNTDGKAA